MHVKKTEIGGVKILPLKTNFDQRGSFTEVYRMKWYKNISLIQWNVVFSKKNALRGMRVHVKHTDYVVLFKGEALYVLRDLRKGSPTEGKSWYLKLSARPVKCIIIPPGIAHGFYFYENSGYIYGVDHYFSEDDELRFHYKDPDMAFKWPAKNPIVTKRDQELPQFKKISKKISALSFS